MKEHHRTRSFGSRCTLEFLILVIPSCKEGFKAGPCYQQNQHSHSGSFLETELKLPKSRIHSSWGVCSWISTSSGDSGSKTCSPGSSPAWQSPELQPFLPGAQFQLQLQLHAPASRESSPATAACPRSGSAIKSPGGCEIPAQSPRGSQKTPREPGGEEGPDPDLQDLLHSSNQPNAARGFRQKAGQGGMDKPVSAQARCH